MAISETFWLLAANTIKGFSMNIIYVITIHTEYFKKISSANAYFYQQGIINVCPFLPNRDKLIILYYNFTGTIKLGRSNF
jgi:hypothetical protein